jgi:3-hydroxymyristoyl/3-hydroxydecanoyl-(acyl carrier protein) dehydratase
MNWTQLIEVRAPYFALDKVVTVGPGKVEASVRPEQPRGSELGPLPAAEAGRHLAIIGSCACASLAPELGKHFYLAQRAVLERTFVPGTVLAAPLRARAEALHRDRRVASAKCVLTDALDRPLYQLSVTYQVLQERLFQRMFSAHKQELRASERSTDVAARSSFSHMRRNPYQSALPLVAMELSAARGVALLPEVTSQLCSGHFPLYPAMPIALLMHGLSGLAGDVLRERLGDDMRYAVARAEVKADRLVFAGQSLTFEANWVRHEVGQHVFLTQARISDGTVVGEMKLVLEAAANDEALPGLRAVS